ncbi:MAG TPA: hypothetical protein VIW68_11765 [Candidatus Sulfotelmatobacter sp.]
MDWLKRSFSSLRPESRRPSVRRVTVDEPLVVSSPKIGFFNLLGATAQAIVDADKQGFRALFASLEESNDVAPKCDVLMIYAHVQTDGSIAGSADGLRDIIRKANAVIVVVASENEAKNYIAASRRTGYGQANLVMTLKRKDAAFTNFFAQLFEKMQRGTSMPVGWVQLAPQAPGATHGNCPESIFSAEISHIVFK